MNWNDQPARSKAFVPPPAGFATKWERALKFVGHFAQSLFERALTISLSAVVVLLWTNAGRQLQTMVGDGYIDARQIARTWCERCYQPPFDFSLALPLVIILAAIYRDSQNIHKVSDITTYTRLPDITATFTILIAITYCLVEVLFGVGEGYQWASDFVVAFAAAWALRFILSWDVYSRQLSDENEQKREEKAADHAALNDDIFLIDRAGPSPPSPPPSVDDGSKFVVTANRLSFAYVDPAEAVFSDLNIAPLEFTRLALLGTSGSGKSTLLKLVGGSLPPKAGTVRVSTADAIAPSFGYVGQDETLISWRSVAGNISLAAYLRGKEPTGPDQSIEEQLLEALDLDDHKFRLPYQLSGGMRKRAALAACLLSGADLFLLDEPFAGSDVRRRTLMYRAIRDACQRTGAAAIFTTHDAVDVIEVADAVLWLDRSVENQAIAIDARQGWTDALRNQLAAYMLGETVG
jgi:ABC-type nitrate/sulfonate/bicarbonate transport system ATPase subunit